MTIRGVEPAVTALTALLAANLPGAVDTINATVTDGYVLDHPADILDYIPATEAITAFPTISIDVLSGLFADDSGYNATGQYDIAVCAFLQHADPAGLARIVRRYELALTRTVLPTSRNWGVGVGLPWSVQLQKIVYGPSYGIRDGDQGQWNAYLTWCQVVVQIKLDEE